MRAFRVVNLGCGTKKSDFPESQLATTLVGIDCRHFEGVDVIHNLDIFPYPLETSAFDLVILQDVLEHLADVPSVMAEVHRISAPGGEVRIRTPHYSSYYAFGDPTHRHYFSSLALESFYSQSGSTYVPHIRFTLVERRILFPKIWRLLGVASLANRFPERWEQLFAFVFRAENLEFRLKILKD